MTWLLVRTSPVDVRMIPVPAAVPTLPWSTSLTSTTVGSMAAAMAAALTPVELPDGVLVEVPPLPAGVLPVFPDGDWAVAVGEPRRARPRAVPPPPATSTTASARSEEHTSELQSL